MNNVHTPQWSVLKWSIQIFSNQIFSEEIENSAPYWEYRGDGGYWERALVPGGSFPLERTNHRLTFSSLPLLPQPNTDNWLGRKRGGLFKYATIYLFSLLSILREPVLLMVTLGSRDTSEMASTSFIQLTVGVGDPKHTENVHFLSLTIIRIPPKTRE